MYNNQTNSCELYVLFSDTTTLVVSPTKVLAGGQVLWLANVRCSASCIGNTRYGHFGFYCHATFIIESIEKGTLQLILYFHITKTKRPSKSSTHEDKNIINDEDAPLVQSTHPCSTTERTVLLIPSTLHK